MANETPVYNESVASVSTENNIEKEHHAAVLIARDGDREKGLSILAKLHAEYPLEYDITFDYIVVLAWDEQWQQAVDEFERLSSEIKTPIYVQKEIAKAYGRLESKEKELAICTEILKEDEHDLEVRQMQFWAALALARHALAGEAVEKLLASSPENREYIFQKAEYLWTSQGLKPALIWLNQKQDKLEAKETEVFLEKLLGRLTEEQWDHIGEWFNEGHGNPLPVSDAVVALAWLERSPSALLEFASRKKAFLENFDQYSDSARLDVAVWVERSGAMEEAKELYKRILKEFPDHVPTIERLANLFVKEGDREGAKILIDKGLKEQPESYGLLLLKAQLLEGEKDFMGAVRVYNSVLQFYPDNQAAYNLKMRALMDLGANSLAVELMEQGDRPADPVLLERGKGNLGMSYVRWSEPREALDVTNRQMDPELVNAPKTEGMTDQKEIPKVDPAAAAVEVNRARWDKMVALGENYQYDEVLKEYDQAVLEGVEIPMWVQLAAADAYLFNREPQKAFEIYEAARQTLPEDFKVNMAYYYTLIDLGRYREAGKLLEDIDARLPAQVLERGVLSDNWQKAEVTYNRIWLLMYQDRLVEAQKLARETLRVSPANTQVRTILAHIYLWRGWPRQALKEFQMVQNMDYENVPATNGYARGLYDNVHKKQARQEIEQASQKYPNNRHVQRARRLILIDGRPLLTFSGYYYNERPGEEELFLDLRGDQPLGDHHQMFAELARRITLGSDGDETADRAYLGDIWRPNNFWKITGAVSADETTGEDAGGLAGIEFTPDDYWTFGLGYDSYAFDVPLRSRGGDVSAMDFDSWARFRLSESFNTLVGFGLRDFSDGNESYNLRWTTDTALTTAAYWKTRLMTEFTYASFSDQGVDYFSPEGMYSFYLIPMVEHTWWRRYEKAWVDRLYLGMGVQSQKGFGTDEAGFIGYELDHRFSDKINGLVGVTYSLKNYDGEDARGLLNYWTLRVRF